MQQFIGKGRTVDIGIGAEHAGPGVDQIPGIGGLVVGRRMRIRHEHRGHGERSDLGHARCARTREHQIGSSQHIAHVVDVRLDAVTLRLLGRQRQSALGLLKAVGTRRMQHIEVLARKQLVFERNHALVEVLGAK